MEKFVLHKNVMAGIKTHEKRRWLELLPASFFLNWDTMISFEAAACSHQV